MRNHRKPFIGFIAAGLIVLLAAVFTAAQTNVTPSRITQAIDPAILAVLRGNTHPLAQPQFDRGPAPASLPMQRMLLVLQRSSAQETALDALLEQQQDTSSPNFHHWLTPQQFGQQFGPSDQDIQTVTSWLESQGFQVDRVSNGRTVIEFSGTAGAVQSAFHTAIHQYAVNNESHWANSSDPEIPAALTPVVAGIATLYNFPRQAMHRTARTFLEPRQGGANLAPAPNYTLPCGTNQSGQPVSCFGVGPYDFATIYNVLPEWNAAINGSGQTIAIAGETDINKSDIEAYQNFFGLSVKDPTIIVNGSDPGIVQGDETESDLDVEVASGIAPGATIDLVVSQTTETSLGVDLSAQYIVDNNLAAVLSESYGVCEFFLGTAGNQFYSQLWQQAAAQGITVVVSSGDGGSAVCDGDLGSQGPAQYGLSVSGFESTPYNISVGGTDFNDVNDPATYWSSTNSSTNKESALGYIPEMTWNNTCTNQELFSVLGTSSAAQTCNDTVITQNPNNSSLLDPVGGSGGKSGCTTSDFDPSTLTGVLSSCSNGYAKPAWQTALTPADGKRDVPDISMFASNGFNGSFYMICEADISFQFSLGPCGSSQLTGIGGTSAPTPAFAGIMALVNQKTNSRWGNANDILYKLAGITGKYLLILKSDRRMHFLRYPQRINDRDAVRCRQYTGLHDDRRRFRWSFIRVCDSFWL
jgi:subtilase family serine protease